MYIASNQKRKNPGHNADQLDRERREFIRRAAIQLCVEHRRQDSVCWDMSSTDTAAVWRAASKLWNDRPEDC